MRTMVIVNPMANKGRAGRRWPALRRELTTAIGAFDEAATTAPGEATVLARSALAAGYRRFVAVGGDGTVNETMNGLVDATGAIDPGIVLCPFPVGTANELCRALSYAPGPAGALAAITSGKTRALDLVRCDFVGLDDRETTRHAYLIVSFGGAAEVSYRASASPWLKKLGQIAYFLMGPPVILRYALRDIGQSIDDGPVARRRVFTGMLGNCENGGGGLKLVPGARPDDGVLDYVELGALRPFETILKIMLALFEGRHVLHPKVSTATGRAFRFTCETPTILDIDGETVGRLPLAASIRPAALRVAVP